MVAARNQAMTAHNINAGWKETGLHPFSPAKVMERLSEPASSVRPSVRTPLGTLSSENHAFQQSFSSSLQRPIKRRFEAMVSEIEALN